ncbi:MAG TPA: hypothetical protein ENK43_05770 [Planctomycetes bacterium]|nr:hypothetical protein [Planctomycetota bacterium]
MISTAEEQRLDQLLQTIMRWIDERETALRAVLRVDRRFMIARILAFLVSLAGFLAAAATKNEMFGWTLFLPGGLFFAMLVLLHAPVRRRRDALRRSLQLLREKGERVANPRRGPVDDPCLDPTRPPILPLATDANDAFPPWPEDIGEELQIYRGESNLFHLLATAPSRWGRLLLHEWLLNSLKDSSAIERRQEAARELETSPEARRDLEEILSAIRGAPDDSVLDDIVRNPEPFPDEGRLPMLPAFMAATLTAIVLAVVFQSDAWFGGAVLIGALGMFIFRRPRAAAVEMRVRLLRIEPHLRAILQVSRMVRTRNFESSYLRALTTRIVEVGLGPAPAIEGALRKWRGLRLYRAGLLFVVLDWFFSCDLFFVARAQAWWKSSRDEVVEAWRSVAALEALCCFANLREEMPDWCWPTPRDAGHPQLEIEGLRHPLISPSVAVGNDLSMGPRLLVVTGSNMAGKTTFLRATGLAVLLAQCGAPVPAERMHWTPLRLLTDIEVHDSLSRGKSYFAAEIERVKAILDGAGADPHQLSLIDEIFRGTNTREKVAAGVEVARWLSASGALTILATHDDEFTHLEETSPDGLVANAHFEDTLEGGRLVFTYRLRAGAARSGNAIRLLEAEGFPPEIIEKAKKKAERHA